MPATVPSIAAAPSIWTTHKRKSAKDFLKNHKDISFKEFVALLDVLFKAKSYDEKSLAAILIGYAHTHGGLLMPKHINVLPVSEIKKSLKFGLILFVDLVWLTV